MSYPIQTEIDPYGYVIHGHGHYSDKVFELDGFDVVSADSLSTGYELVIPREQPFSIRNQPLPPLKNGNWQLNRNHHTIHDVQLSPWSDSEYATFQERLQPNPQLAGYYAYRDDPQSYMIVRNNGQLSQVSMSSFKQNPNGFDALACVSPQAGQIKILKPCCLSDITGGMRVGLQPNLLVLATCNSKNFLEDKTIFVSDKGPSSDLEQLFATKPSLTPMMQHHNQSLGGFSTMNNSLRQTSRFRPHP